MNVVDYIVFECHRQHDPLGTEAMHRAYTFALWFYDSETPPTESNAQFIAYLIKSHDQCNQFGDSNNYRTTPITIGNIVTGTHPAHIDRQMRLLFDNVPDGSSVSEVDEFIKHLLDIHPWADGNGRTASVLRNWLLNTLDDPQLLPYYYG